MEDIRIDIADRIAIVTLDRPPVNALSYQTFEELAGAMEQLSSGREASVIVLRAADGARAFCGGVDLPDSARRHRPDGRPEDGAPQLITNADGSRELYEWRRDTATTVNRIGDAIADSVVSTLTGGAGEGPVNGRAQ